MLIVLALAWLYVHYGTLPQADGFLYGIKPVVVAIIAQALWGLSRSVLKGFWPILLAVVILVLYIVGINSLLLLVGGGLFLGIVRWIERHSKADKEKLVNVFVPFPFLSLNELWHTLLEGINIAALGLMGGVLFQFATYLYISSKQKQWHDN
jgi:chromate transport protein ChrA